MSKSQQEYPIERWLNNIKKDLEKVDSTLENIDSYAGVFDIVREYITEASERVQYAVDELEMMRYNRKHTPYNEGGDEDEV